MNRRNFCIGALSTAFFYELIAHKLYGLSNEAYAQTGATPIKNYVSFWMNGGAERCWFDNILTPNGATDTLGAGPGISTYLNVEAGNKFEYRTTTNKVNNKFYLPYLWESKLPTAEGGIIAMSSLASNVAIVRGVHTGLTFGAHKQNAIQVQIPLPNLSILGSITDISNSLIPAIITNGEFLSNKNKSATFLGPTSDADEIFGSLKFNSRENTPYRNAPTAIVGHRKMDNIVTSFINSISSQRPARFSKSVGIMMDNRRTVIDLIEKGFGSISADYAAAVTRYTSIITQVMNPTSDRRLEGLDTRPVVGSSTRVRYWEDQVGSFSNSFSLIEGFNTAKCFNMIHAFAKAEVYLKHNITNCMQLEISEINLISDQYAQNDGNRKNLGFDMHYTGDLMRGFAMSRFYQCFAACMIHFRGQLGPLWGQTLVNLRSEFNREGNAQHGSEHGLWSNPETFFSGAVKSGPIVVGNIYDRYQHNSSCMGDGAPLEELGNQVAEAKHTFSTVGVLTGYVPSRNHPALLGPVNGEIVPLAGPPKNIKKVG